MLPNRSFLLFSGFNNGSGDDARACGGGGDQGGDELRDDGLCDDELRDDGLNAFWHVSCLRRHLPWPVQTKKAGKKWKECTFS